MNEGSAYNVDGCVAEIYDQTETQREDVALIRRLVGEQGSLRILEPFCGNGRILIPMASDGHEVVGMDRAGVMLESARDKLSSLGEEVRRRVTLIQADVTKEAWPAGFDLVILGGNCFYELATPEEQEGCIASAAAALRPGGFVYVDNNHMEGDLDEAWRGHRVRTAFPTGTCADGTKVHTTTETVWWDVPKMLVRYRRSTTITFPDGTTKSKEWIENKHPPSALEVRGWLEGHGFAIERLYGDRAGHAYTDESPRAIFWARKRE